MTLSERMSPEYGFKFAPDPAGGGAVGELLPPDDALFEEGQDLNIALTAIEKSILDANTHIVRAIPPEVVAKRAPVDEPLERLRDGVDQLTESLLYRLKKRVFYIVHNPGEEIDPNEIKLYQLIDQLEEKRPGTPQQKIELVLGPRKFLPEVTQEETRNEAELQGQIAEFETEFAQIQTAGAYQNTKEQNELREAISPLQEKLLGLRRTGLDEARWRELEFRLQTLEFVVTKGSILKSMLSVEANEDGAVTMDGFSKDVLSPMLTRLDTICKSVVDSTRQGEFVAEYKRFKTEIENTAMLQMAGKSVKDSCLGTVASAGDEVHPLTLPASLPVFCYGFTNDKLAYFLRAEMGSCQYDYLKSNQETEPVNEVIETRRIKVYDPSVGAAVEQDMEVTAMGEALRHLDLFFGGQAPEMLPYDRKLHYWDRRSTFYSMPGGEITGMVKEFEKARLDELYVKDWEQALNNRTPYPDRNDERYQVKIKDRQILRAWNISIMLAKPFTLAPGSFSKGAPAYYAYNADYAISETIGATSEYIPFLIWALIGYGDVNAINESNPNGTKMLLDEMSHHHEPKNIYEKVHGITKPSDLRDTIRTAFRNAHVDEYYDALFIDLPLFTLFPVGVVPKGPPKSDPAEQALNYRTLHRVFATPLETMVERDASGNPIKDERLTNAPYRTFESIIDETNVDPTTSIKGAQLLYERMGFTAPASTSGASPAQRASEQLPHYINNAKNIADYHSKILSMKPGELIATKPEDIAARMKNTKYANSLLMPLAPNLAWGTGEDKIEEEEIRKDVALVILFIKGMLMLHHDGDINKVRTAFSQVNLDDKNGKDAILLALEAGWGTGAMIKGFLTEFINQVQKAQYFK
jgi:hypothetical protein